MKTEVYQMGRLQNFGLGSLKKIVCILTNSNFNRKQNKILPKELIYQNTKSKTKM